MRRLIDMSFEIPCKARLNLGLFCLGRQMQKPAELISVREKRRNHLTRTRSMSSDQKIRSLRSNFLTPKHRHRGSKCKKKGDAKALLKITQLKQKPNFVSAMLISSSFGVRADNRECLMRDCPFQTVHVELNFNLP